MLFESHLSKDSDPNVDLHPAHFPQGHPRSMSLTATSSGATVVSQAMRACSATFTIPEPSSCGRRFRHELAGIPGSRTLSVNGKSAIVCPRPLNSGSPLPTSDSFMASTHGVAIKHREGSACSPQHTSETESPSTTLRTRLTTTAFLSHSPCITSNDTTRPPSDPACGLRSFPWT